MKKLLMIGAVAAAGLLLPAAGEAAQTGGWAVIDDSGILIKGSGVKKVKSLGTGEYEVRFKGSVKKCAAVATAGAYIANVQGPTSVTFWSRPSSKNNKTIEVFAYDNGSEKLLNTSFSVIVTC